MSESSAGRQGAVAPSSPAIATPHRAATAVGARVLADGGTAVDAAVAAAATLCVVFPNNVALGSDLVALVRSSDGRISCVNGTGPSPRALRLGALRERYGEAMPARGVDTITVPGAVRGWGALLDLGGTIPLADLLAPAIELAAYGVPVARSVAAAIVEERTHLAADDGCRALLLPDSANLLEGAPLHQPALATSLRDLAERGVDEFYTGELARRWLGGLRRLGCTLDAVDLADFRPEVAAPLSGDWEGLTVHTSPPNTQGFLLLRALESLTPSSDAAELASAFRAGNAVRDTTLADPAAGRRGDTVGIAAVSADGFAVSLLQSVYSGFGAAVLEPETGILFHNRGRSFSLDPEHPNCFAPGKRPAHTLMPVLATRDGAPAFVAATMGGQGQPQIHAQVLLAAARGMHPARAVSDPRFVVGQQEAGDTATTVTVESDAPASTLVGLRDLPWSEVRVVPPHDESLGHAQLIEITPAGVVRAGSDPRADGSAVVL